ncbi:MAG TPA: sigma-70 family RNA polymerase sigma factor [Frankiaceae bacterium]|nr:sigma-70 family RNA polymerase sigma factor [Frankiaceae bacterium]
MRLDADTGDLLRELAPQVLGVLARRSGDFAAAEDAVQEALLAAAQHWPEEGRPDNPRGWLLQVASRRLINQVRSEQARRRRENTAALLEPEPAEVEGGDDTLLLLFLCCHPDLTSASAIALTLRAVGGLTTAEIASAFLVPETTVAQRISRAKSRIQSSGAIFSMPTRQEWEPRLQSVLRVLYLIFNEGYARSGGQGVYRAELSAEAIRLARMLHALLPADSEIAGLLALMLLTDARRPARTGPDGELVPLSTQRRDLWNRAQISEGVRLITAALAADAIGEYQAQAAIAALHDDAPDASETDWPQILHWYGELEQLTGNPVVTLNRAVALAMVDGPVAGLTLLDSVEERLPDHYRLDAVRAHLHEMAGDKPLALQHFRAAAARTTSAAEQQYLLTQAARLGREVG